MLQSNVSKQLPLGCLTSWLRLQFGKFFGQRNKKCNGRVGGGPLSLPSALGLVGTYAAGVLVEVAGAQHVLRDPARSRASIAPPAPLVSPHLHVHLHQVGWLAATLGEGSPSRHCNLLTLEVLPGVTCQADVLDVVGRLDGLVQGQDGNIVPLKELNLENKGQ